MAEWSITPKNQVTKTLRMPADVVEELEAVAYEVSTEDAKYTFTDVTVDLIRKALAHYRETHPRTAPHQVKHPPAPRKKSKSK